MSTSELKQECCVVTIGRFNPPTKGHVYAVFKKLVDKATKNSCRGIILTTRSNDNRNPLPVSIKKEFIKKSIPTSFGASFKIVNGNEWTTTDKRYVIADVPNIILALSELHKANRTINHVIVVLGQDEIEALAPRIKKYNGTPITPDSKSLYNFETLEFVEAGVRGGVSGLSAVSATKMRNAAKLNEFDVFKTMCSDALSEDDKKELFKLVQQGLK